VRVHDPVRIAEGVTLENCELGPNLTVETGCVIRNSRLQDSIVGSNTTILGSALSGSLIGDDVRVTNARGTLNVGDQASVELE
jgi:UDP-3-O-[3-hydroxymyristoyl] glucosamine N-acyltransferase